MIAQGVEAGGHVRGSTPALELLARVRAALPDGYPVLSAGGIAEAADTRARLDAGAEAVVSGTRFLMSEESGGHPAYKQRLIGARETLLTELFGAGWPAPHRVVPNAATARWLRRDPRSPGWLRLFHRATAPAFARVPVALQLRLAGTQKPSQAAVRARRGDRGRTAEPRGRGPALRRRVRRPDRRHPPGRRSGLGAGGIVTAAFVYLLRCGDGTLYCGWTNDVPRRLAQHQDGTASRYTRARLPVELAWSKRMASRSDAMSEEARIKRLSRAEKLDLIGARRARPSGRARAGTPARSRRRRPAAPEPP